ncbi:MAG: energy transducer TonB [Leptospiraceae bacterium]|nr:energy transducer TonB [Leptospiraceae bacterium]MCB1171181.1 energy transducer TonB [Leptospiraceae bacterium]
MLRPLENFPLLLIVSASIHILAGFFLWISLSGSPQVTAISNPGFAVLSVADGTDGKRESESPADSRTSNSTEGQKETGEDQGAARENQGLLTETIGNLKQSIPYPALARSQEIQGTVVVSIRLKSGRLEAVSVVRSSGYSILDNQVLSSLRGWQWPNVSGERTFDVVFEIVR